MSRGSFNHLIIVLGQPGTGKSTYAFKRAKQFISTPAYVIAHDPGWRLPEDASLVRHRTFNEAAIGLGKLPSKVHALSTSEGEDVVGWGIEVAQASANQSKTGNGCPVVVLLDEGVGTSGINPYRLSPRMRDFVATRRHHNVGLIVTAQSPLLMHYQLLGLSTEIVMFRLIDERGLARLETIGVPRNLLDAVKRLPNYKSITHVTG
jgi:hypothetical protein